MDDQNKEVKTAKSPLVKILQKIVAIITKINEVVGKFCAFTLLALLLLMILEVFRRYVLQSPSIWGYDFSLWLFGMPALLAGGWVYSEHAMVNMDMLYNKFSPRGKAILDTITAFVFFVFIIIMTQQCFKAANLAITRNEMSITNWKIKIWPVKIWMPVASTLMLAQGAAEFIKNLYMAVTGRGLMEQ